LGLIGVSFCPGAGIAMNTINVIAPYKHLGMWVFDDPRVGLSKEPFVSGADAMIDRVVADIPNADSGFRLIHPSVPQSGALWGRGACRRCEIANASGNAKASSPGGFAPGLEGTDLKMRGWGREARPAKQTLS
jgi:hypothetical protein